MRYYLPVLVLIIGAVIMTGCVGMGSPGTGVALVAIVTNRVSRPVRGLGIVTPFFIPPLCALACGLVLSAGMISLAAPIIAYVSGTLGTLIGADILNLHRIGELGAPVASIGGAGTFDGVFLSGIIAAFLA
jgi:uncharacterized membrane protein